MTYSESIFPVGLIKTYSQTIIQIQLQFYQEVCLDVTYFFWSATKGHLPQSQQEKEKPTPQTVRQSQQHKQFQSKTNPQK
jgi:nicotinamide riboside transporter PnuC